VLVFSFDLSWLSPLLIFVGVLLYLTRENAKAGRFGHILIGLGLIIMALQLIVLAAKPLTQAAGVQVIFGSLTGDVLLDMLVGATFSILAYSSLAVVLLTAALAGSSAPTWAAACWRCSTRCARRPRRGASPWATSCSS
jgi:phosphate:Na+ symporter